MVDWGFKKLGFSKINKKNNSFAICICYLYEKFKGFSAVTVYG